MSLWLKFGMLDVPPQHTIFLKHAAAMAGSSLLTMSAIVSATPIWRKPISLGWNSSSAVEMRSLHRFRIWSSFEAGAEAGRTEPKRELPPPEGRTYLPMTSRGGRNDGGTCARTGA